MFCFISKLFKIIFDSFNFDSSLDIFVIFKILSLFSAFDISENILSWHLKHVFDALFEIIESFVVELLILGGPTLNKGLFFLSI